MKRNRSPSPDVIRLEKTCDACPEQYDAFIGKARVGYIRLRGGRFRVMCPDVGGTVVLQETLDDAAGCFSDEERPAYLQKAKLAILRYVIEHAA